MTKEEIIQIKSIDGSILFEYAKENNTILDTVEEAVRQHVHLNRANLSGADLYGANLYRANLSNAHLYGADLHEANLYDASLSGAILSKANLYGTNFFRADLYGANLRGANLYWANLRGANLYGADFYEADFCKASVYGANFSGINLQDANNINNIPLSCPSHGSFIGWKKVRNSNEEFLIKLEIPEDAQRSSATTDKCRCDKAKVLEITSIDGSKKYDSVINNNYVETLYTVGEIVYPNKFDDNRWNECSSGIHFFINKQEAIDYRDY